MYEFQSKQEGVCFWKGESGFLPYRREEWSISINKFKRKTYPAFQIVLYQC